MSNAARDGPSFTKATLLSKELVPGLFTHQFYAFDEPTRSEEERLETKVLSLSCPDKVYKRDMLMALGAPVVYAILCAMHGTAIPNGVGVPFMNCSCSRHEWFLGALRPREASATGSQAVGSRSTSFLVTCGGLLYLVKAKICEATGLMTIVGVLDWNTCTLPGLMAPCGRFVALMMDLNLYHWDLRNKGRVRVGLSEDLESRTKNVFSDSDPSDNSTIGEMPERSAPSKKHPASPFL